MPRRVYICGMGGGMGDLGHMIDRASANMALDLQFRIDNPETYIIEGMTKGYDKKIRDKLSELDPSHPLHISNLGSSLYIEHIVMPPEASLPPEKSFLDAIVYGVSHSNPYPDVAAGIRVSNAQLGVYFSTENNPVNRNMGFGNGRYGFFVKNEPTAANINMENLIRDLANCTDKELLMRV